MNAEEFDFILWKNNLNFEIINFWNEFLNN
jgi:hypothetical protein